MRLGTTLLDNCFKECVTDFAKTDLTDSETKCIQNCTTRDLTLLTNGLKTYHKQLN